jgi:hypothetical protein
VDIDGWKRHISEDYAGVLTMEAFDDFFYIYDPDRNLPDERKMPFATIVTGNHYDTVSDLDRPGAWRLNVGLTKATYAGLFAAAPPGTTYDHAATDTVLPHPEYAGQHWVCVVDPGPATERTLRTLLAEAHAYAARKHANWKRRAESV